MRILQVNTKDVGGGAEKIALTLHHAFRALGHPAFLAVSEKLGCDVSVLPMAVDGAWAAFWRRKREQLVTVQTSVRGVGLWQLVRMMPWLVNPRAELCERLGWENFHFPGARQLLRLAGNKPDILNCHNLHGGYFDLRLLPWLSRQCPVVLTLHDAWLLSGHCAHSFDCERWVTGCGQCPDLTIYPAVRRDATMRNWSKKRRIYGRSRLFVATPSRWLMEKVKQSMLVPGIVECRMIPNGVDVSVFKPADKNSARKALGLPVNHKVLLFAANGIRRSIWKDYRSLREAISILGSSYSGDLLFLALGEKGPAEQFGRAELRFVPYQEDERKVAEYYQAADLYVHAAVVDTFPNTVIESLACGTPAVATAVGGIPEQIKSFKIEGVNTEGRDVYGPDEATGVLVPRGDAGAMAKAIGFLLQAPSIIRQLGDNAADDARVRFSSDRQASEYLRWYSDILTIWPQLQRQG